MNDKNDIINHIYQENDYLLELNSILNDNCDIFEQYQNSLTNIDIDYNNDNDTKSKEITLIDCLNEQTISKKNYPKEPENLDSFKHTKFKKDNILRRIKVHFFKFIINLCNDYIKKIYKKQKFKFTKIENNKNISDVSIRFNLDLKEQSLSYILCDIGNKKKNFDSTKNYKLINKLINDREPFKDFFNLKIEYLYNLFILKGIRKTDLVALYGLRKAKTMEDYINIQLENKYDDNHYLDMFRFYALNFFQIFDVKFARIRKQYKES